MDDASWVYDKLSILGPDQVNAWTDTSNVDRLCDRCQTIDWEPTLLYLSVADEYSFYPKVRLYRAKPQVRDIRDAAHVGCHLCSLILTCLLTLRYGYSAQVHPVPRGLDEVTDSASIEIDVEGMPGTSPVWLTITIADHGNFSGWRSFSLPVRSVLPRISGEFSCTTPADQIARKWLNECLQNHKTCSTEVPRLPRRIINVTHDLLRLEEPGPKHAHYATLSYTIGGAHLFTTTSAVLDDRKAGFSLSSLPLTAQHAVWWTRKLDLHYLWLDSLCILQDNLHDWQLELSTMATIYENATITLAATRASSAHNGCAPSLNKLTLLPCRPHPSIVILPDYEREDWIFLRGALDSRAWCFQEVQLSRRVLRVGSEELAWQCRQCKRLEGDPARERVHDVEASLSFFGTRALDVKFDYAGNKNDQLSFVKWYALVQQYGRRNLTFVADRLPAFSGMAHKFHSILHATYLAGLWQEDIFRGLLWRMRDPGRYVMYQAPSWSWASVEGGWLVWTVWIYNVIDFCAELLDVWVRVNGVNPYGRVSAAKLTLFGQIAPLPSYLLGDDNEVGPVDWRQYLLFWDREDFPGIGCVFLKLHATAYLILQPADSNAHRWSRVGTVVTPSGDQTERQKLAADVMNGYEWKSAVVSIV